MRFRFASPLERCSLAAVSARGKRATPNPSSSESPSARVTSEKEEPAPLGAAARAENEATLSLGFVWDVLPLLESMCISREGESGRPIEIRPPPVGECHATVARIAAFKSRLAPYCPDDSGVSPIDAPIARDGRAKAAPYVGVDHAQRIAP